MHFSHSTGVITLYRQHRNINYAAEKIFFAIQCTCKLGSVAYTAYGNMPFEVIRCYWLCIPKDIFFSTFIF